MYMRVFRTLCVITAIVAGTACTSSAHAQDDPVIPSGNPYYDNPNGNGGMFSSDPDPFGTGTIGTLPSLDSIDNTNKNGQSTSSFGPGGGPGGPTDPPNDVNAPIDGGVSLLLIAGAAAGVRMRNRKKMQQQQPVAA